MPHPTAVILVVGLNRSLLQHAPRIKSFADSGSVHTLEPVLPAVTCSIQSSMLTGLLPREHGIVGNGWYNRELAEIHFWKQSNHLVTGEKVWDIAKKRDPQFTCANLFWWFNMYSSVDYSVTPRPIYTADGRKIPDIYTEPSGLRERLQSELGQFPLFNFWGPASSIVSSKWIADAARIASKLYKPTLNLVYLPHLDYSLQRFGTEHERIPDTVREIDDIVGGLIDHYTQSGIRVIILSEYGIESVDQAVYINRHLRELRELRVREEEGLELLDPGASAAFAVADHQIAHVYVRNSTQIERIADLCSKIPGVEEVLTRRKTIDHTRAGDLILIARKRHWFTYDYWLDDACAPDFARTVDIHRKPGYDPRELFIDPEIYFPKTRIAWKIIRKSMGFRTLLDVIPLHTRLVRGSHGRIDQPNQFKPVLITNHATELKERLHCTDVRDVILDHLFAD